jgi:hypothetical protein
MAINITSTKEQSSFIKMMVYGDAGVGKTSLIATAPDPIIISSESGLLSISDFDIPVIKIQSYEDLIEAYQYLVEDEIIGKYKTICVDSITDIAETILSEYKKTDKDPRRSYGQMADDVMVMIKAFRDMEKYNVYMTAKMARLEDSNTGFCAYRPSFPGQQLNMNIPYFFDELLHLGIGVGENSETYRYLRCKTSITHVAKDRSGKLDEFEPANLTLLFDKIRGNNETKQHIDTKPAKSGDKV